MLARGAWWSSGGFRIIYRLGRAPRTSQSRPASDGLRGFSIGGGTKALASKLSSSSSTVAFSLGDDVAFCAKPLVGNCARVA